MFKCKHCGKQFSVTLGTIFANRKLPMRDYLLAISLFVNTHKGLSALQLSRDLGVQYKTAFILSHKIRESIRQEVQSVSLSGEVEVDGAYFGGYIKPSKMAGQKLKRQKTLCFCYKRTRWSHFACYHS